MNPCSALSSVLGAAALCAAALGRKLVALAAALGAALAALAALGAALAALGTTLTALGSAGSKYEHLTAPPSTAASAPSLAHAASHASTMMRTSTSVSCGIF